MEVLLNQALAAIFQRRAIKFFDPVEIPDALRDQILDAARFAPSSLNRQPYRFYWVRTPAMRKAAAELAWAKFPPKPLRP
jgi:nitroreductase